MGPIGVYTAEPSKMTKYFSTEYDSLIKNGKLKFKYFP